MFYGWVPERGAMFADIFNKLSEFAHHHQAFFAGVIAVSVICCSWGLEKIIEEYLLPLFPHNKLYGYILVIAFGLAVLWITQHVILHVI